MRRHFYRLYSVAIILILLGISLQWLLLSGNGPFSIVADWQKFLVAARSANGGGVVSGNDTEDQLLRGDFQTGVVFPRWGTTAYSPRDANWPIGLHEIQQQTAAQWIELTINLYQSSPDSTQVLATAATPSPQSLAAGILAAHAMHFHVFVVPLLSLEGTSSWSGGFHFRSSQQTQAWFSSYWRVYKPYALAAAQAGAEQLAIGTELQGLESASSTLWNGLIQKVHSIFPGRLTYDMNFVYPPRTFPSWMRNPLLSAIGISTYYPLTTIQEKVDPKLLSALWEDEVKSNLDALAVELGRPILISEIGYRNSADAVFNPWNHTTLSPLDPIEQAAAYNAALLNVVYDPRIIGIYFWGWSIPYFAPNWQPAARVLKCWYTTIKPCPDMLKLFN